MTVRGTITAFQTAMDAAVARDASPVQTGDITTWDPIRQMLLDLIETALDEATMRGVVLGASVIIESYLANGAVTADKLGSGAVVSAKIGDLQVLRSKIANLAVNEGKIATGAVTEAKLGTGAVTHTKLATDAVEHDNLADDSVGSDQLQDNSVQEAHIAANAVREAAINDGSVTGDKLASDQRVVQWARANSPSGRMPAARALASTVVSGQFGNRSGDSRKSLLLTQASGGAVSAPIDQIVADVLTDMVTGNTETNIAVTVSGSGANAKLNFVVTGGGGTPAPGRSSVLYSAITTTVRAPTAADFTTPATGNREATGDRIQMDGWQGDRQLHIAIPTSEADPTSITLLGDRFMQNYIGTRTIQFAKRTGAGIPLTIGTDGAHNVWSTNGLVASTLFEASGTDAAPTFIIGDA